MRNYDAPFPGTGGNTLYTSVEMNTPSPPGNSPVFWRSTDGSVSWGFSYNAIGQLSTATQLDTAAAEGGIGLWRCHAASATSSCDTVYSLVKLINGPAYWNVVPGTSLSVNDPNHTYKESFTQIGGYRYFAAPYASASAHSCGSVDPSCPESGGAGTANFGNTPSSSNYFQVNYAFREMQ